MTNLNPLLTDLYQLTMAAAYWKSGRAERDAVFHLFFRKLPFSGGYAVAAGLADVIQFLQSFVFEKDELAYLSTLKGNDGSLLFDSDFLDYLRGLRVTCDVDAIPEGTVVFPHEPLLRIRGPIVQGQLFESALLNLVNFQTLIATKAARVVRVDSYSGFHDNGRRASTGLGEWLRAQGVSEISVCGLATDYCVKFTVLDALREGFHVTLLADVCRGVNLSPCDVEKAIAVMHSAGAVIAGRVAV